MLSILTLTTNSMHAQDWPNLERFATDNALIKSNANMTDRVVFMGNSITEGWEAIRPDYFVDNNYINRGISGQTTPQMLLRFRQDVVDLEPAAVVILAGINDIAGNTGPSTIQMIADNIFSMAEIAVANDIKVILCSVLPAYDFPWNPGIDPAQKVVELNQLIETYADEKGHPYVDYFSAMADDRNGLPVKYAEDGIHPNALGYSVMEPILEEVVGVVLGK